MKFITRALDNKFAKSSYLVIYYDNDNATYITYDGLVEKKDISNIELIRHLQEVHISRLSI